MDSNLDILLKLMLIYISWEMGFLCTVIHNQFIAANSPPVASKGGHEITWNETVFLAVSALNCRQSADSLSDNKHTSGGFLLQVYFGVHLVAESNYHM